MDFVAACKIAKEFYSDNLKIDGIAKALENSEKWFFSSGVPMQMRVGNTVISVDKRDGKIEVVKLPSKENLAILRSATPVDLPEEITGR